MYHPIEFCRDFITDLEISPKHRLERLRIRKGMRVYASLHASIVETDEGPVEVADLHFDDGTVARQIRYEQFSFVE
jgi:hypothetical protein